MTGEEQQLRLALEDIIERLQQLLIDSQDMLVGDLQFEVEELNLNQ